MNFFIDKSTFKNDNYFIFLPNNKEIVPVKYKSKVRYDDILFVEKQKDLILKNTKNLLTIKILTTFYYGVQVEWENPLWWGV